MVAAQRRVKDLKSDIGERKTQLKTLGAAPDKGARQQMLAALHRQQALLERRHINNLNRWLALGKERISLIAQWVEKLRDHFQTQQKQHRQETIEDLKQQHSVAWNIALRSAVI